MSSNSCAPILYPTNLIRFLPITFNRYLHTIVIRCYIGFVLKEYKKGHAMGNANITDSLQSGSKARLIPVVADSKKEERATSVLLSTFMLVPQFANNVLSEAGVKIGVRTDIRCYTEIVFKNDKLNNLRPDGLIVLTQGSKSWSALIESKIGNNNLDKEQIEAYLDLAKEVKADALITISNQFATIPTHHPVSVNKSKTRSIGLYHFSWLSLLSKAYIMSEAKSVDDREQSFILRELIRYLDHHYSGVSPMSAMNSEWRDVCTQIQQGAILTKNEPTVEKTAMSWQQLVRYMAIELSRATNSMVQVSLSRAEAKDPTMLLQNDITTLVSKSALFGALSVPNAAGNINVCADIRRRVLSLSMSIDAPSNKSRASASINWLTRQLKKLSESDLIIKAIWPGRAPDTQCQLSKTLQDPNTLVPEGMKGIPKSFEVIRIVDLGAKFKGQKVFVESTIPAVRTYYQDVGENVTKWVAPPPKTKTEEEKSQNNSFADISQGNLVTTMSTTHSSESNEQIKKSTTTSKQTIDN
ncbi:MAG: hypothetical protein JAY94_03140 [Candidatus Thiodiazotropha endolucinida]|nr:hypothetical protein [Candidatus Thiodiazotropha taylori]MCW4316483.1 hypothetical protein [Candidatus Thiodiazotropha taylori]